ncbi:hypothetical protein NA56DRAFT_700326 [Hyaloscypha hepaticicola]|uniref:Uncharacterized protein n=1 Tax=Hyaloscypha hepaticicola TaxID=2082293 RepID=A0A2J6QEJ6_9HELO|nr:hypothetical protein NA56DRAFT_700326 [Hyaloscypha hepaticicola]
MLVLHSLPLQRQAHQAQQAHQATEILTLLPTVQQDLLLLDLPVPHGPNLSSPASTAHGPVSAQGVKVRSIAASSSDSSHLEIPQLPATPIVQLESHLDHWAFCSPIVILSALRFGAFHSIKLLFNAKSGRLHRHAVNLSSDSKSIEAIRSTLDRPEDTPTFDPPSRVSTISYTASGLARKIQYRWAASKGNTALKLAKQRTLHRFHLLVNHI